MRNVSLIGMPGSGKSTVGVLLAKELGFSFVDTDLLIQRQEGALLQSVLDRLGHKIRIQSEVGRGTKVLLCLEREELRPE